MFEIICKIMGDFIVKIQLYSIKLKFLTEPEGLDLIKNSLVSP